jgi:hypothetical protein
MSKYKEIKQLLIRLQELEDDDQWRPEEERETKKELIDSVPLLLKALELACAHMGSREEHWIERAEKDDN